MYKNKFIQWFMLLSSFVVLLSMVVPHHHHADGMPCVDWSVVSSWLGVDEHSDDDSYDCCEDDGCDAETPSHQHDCGCSGHNLSFSPNESGHDDSIPFLLVPLCVLFDYYELLSTDIAEFSYLHSCFYAEVLYDAHIDGGAGLRGPPCCFNC